MAAYLIVIDHYATVLWSDRANPLLDAVFLPRLRGIGFATTT